MAEIDVGYTSLTDAPVREAPEPFQGKNIKMQLIEADIVKNPEKQSVRLTFKADVLEGEHARKKVFGGINIINKNPEAQKIGQAELAELTAALKHDTIPRDTAELLFRPFSADVAIAPARVDKETKKSYDAKSEIKRFKLYDGTAVREAKTSTGGSGAGTPPAQTTSAAASAGKRPWD